MEPLDIALVGPGRLGSVLLHHLTTSGHRVRAIRSRRTPANPKRNIGPESPISDTWVAPEPWPRVDLILVTVPDRSIGPVAHRLAADGLAGDGTVVLHTSGLLTGAILGPCRESGAAVGSWHPLQSFAPNLGEVPIAGVFCAIEGDREAVTVGEQLAGDLGMTPWRIRPDAKVLYHAAAALAGNLGHLLVVEARRLLATAGLSEDQSSAALAPLMRTSLESALRASGLEGLTGPMARGDLDVIARHLEVLPPHLAAVYEALWRHVSETVGGDG